MAIPISAVGSEFLVNTQTAGSQDSPAITGLSNGGFVVSWQDFSGSLGDSSGYSVKAQIFAADGSSIGSEFLVNTQTASHQISPTITGLNDGGFVATWYDYSGTLGDGSGTSIKAQMFAADGTRVGSEFLVNTQTASLQQHPTVTALQNGGFAVTWQDLSASLGDSSGTSIKAQIFAADGSTVGSEFLVNTQTANVQTVPTIAGLSNGGFVVTWQDASGTLGDASASIKAQVFTADGNRVGTEFRVNTQTAGSQDSPVITGLSNGGFVVTWQDALGDSSGGGIAAQVFAADGSKIGSQFPVNTQTASSQTAATVTALINGTFIVAWQDASGTLGDNSGSSIKAQVFAADGSRIGAEFLVNTETANSQYFPAITGLGNGGLVVSWQDASGTMGDNSAASIKAQIYAWDTTAPTGPTVSNNSVAGGYVNAANDTAAQALSGTAEAESTVNIYLNGSVTPSYTVTADTDGNWSVTIGKLADGSYSYTATATDLVGNTSTPSAPLNFIVDTAPPVPAITSITPDGASTVTVSGTIGIADAGRTVTLADATLPFAPGTWSATTTADANGNWSITGVSWAVLGSPIVYAHDAAGGLGTSSYVFTAAWANGRSVSTGDRQHVHGVSSGFVVDAGAEQNVYVDGLADGAVILGTQYAWGTALNTTISGGNQYVWGKATGTTITAGVQHVVGTADGTLIQSGGEQQVYTGAVIENTTIAAGGKQLVFGNVTDTIVVGGEQDVHVNGIATGTILNGGSQVDWGTAIDTTINSGTQYVWGTATGTTINAGQQRIAAGGTASDTVIGSGTAHVVAGGAIHDVTFDGPSGTLSLAQSSAFSGTISGWDNGDRILLDDFKFGITMAYTANADHTGGTLTVSDSTHVATLTLLGQYTAADFALRSHGGGIMIYDPGTPVQAQNVLAAATG